ncbi:MAG: M81 family metallopeptidase [Pseudomonadota bacterium]
MVRPLRGLVFILCCFVWSGANAADDYRPLKIAVALFAHEATTFSPEKADVGDFSPEVFEGEELLKVSETMEGLVKFAGEQPGIDVIPLRSFGRVVGGSSRGYITRAAFEKYTGMIIEDLKAAGDVDAVYLDLHGCAAVDGIERPEAELAKRIREVVGDDVPIAATFDPHGNEDDHFLKYADFSLAMKYFPHYDGRLQGQRAARLLIRAARGDYVSTTATRRPGIITPTVLQWTGADPWMSIIQRALVWEAREEDVFVSVFFGFPWNDSVDAGTTIQVMTNNDQALADKIAQDLSDYVWRRRRELFTVPIIKPDVAVAKAIEATDADQTPVVLADYSDRSGDATHILSEIVEQDLGGVLYATLRDERAIDALEAQGAKPGDTFDREVGGFVNPDASGSPVRIKGTLRYFGKVKEWRSIRVAVVEFGRGNYLVLTDELVQIMRPEWLAAFGVPNMDDFTSWVLKSRAHFRRGFDDTGYAKTIMIVDAPGPFLGTVHLDALDFKNVKLDELFPFSEGGVEAAARAGQ